ncbi:MAG: 50S ribosomal protein L6 [Actinobacteria bacterium]|nr:MAG: 50S ribosomal protein L6 [Actinomycetota bacterium]
MSRIGKQPIELPAGVSVALDPGRVMVNGPLGELTQQVPQRMKIEQREKGFERRLELHGVGYRAAMQGTDLRLDVGYSHPVVMKAPQGIAFEVPVPTEIIVRGTDKQQVGQVTAEIRKVRPPEPYKGKGIRRKGEYVRRKVGKRA